MRLGGIAQRVAAARFYAQHAALHETEEFVARDAIVVGSATCEL